MLIAILSLAMVIAAAIGLTLFLIKITHTMSYIQVTLIDGTIYKLPYSFVLNCMIEEEMHQTNSSRQKATSTIKSILAETPRAIHIYCKMMDMEVYKPKLELVSLKPTKTKLKFAWRNADFKVVHPKSKRA